MLQQTFIHIPGIGKQTEIELWGQGIRSWDDADRFEKRFGAVGDAYTRNSTSTSRCHEKPFDGRMQVSSSAYPGWGKRGACFLHSPISVSTSTSKPLDCRQYSTW